MPIQRVNFADDNPAPPTGMVNVRWQSDPIPGSYTTPRDFSAYVDPTELVVPVMHGFGAAFDGAGVALVAGMVAYMPVPQGGTITAWNILVDTGTATIKVWKVARNSAIPVVGDSISTSGVSISSGTAIHSTDVSDFTDLVVADGDVVAVYLQAVSGATKVVFSMEMN